MLKQAVLLCGVFAVAYAALSRGPLQPKPEKFKDVPGCYIPKLDIVVPTGESRAAPAPECYEARCGTDNITYVSCAPVKPPKTCKRVADDTKTFPKCCPRIQCPK